MHFRLCFVAIVILCNCQSAVGKLPSFGPFQRFFRGVHHEEGKADNAGTNGAQTSLISAKSIRGNDNAGETKFGERILTSISESPRLQELILVLTNRVVSFGLFFLAFRMISRSVVASVNLFTTNWEAMKDATRPSNLTQYLKPNTTLNSYEEEILNTIIVPASIERGMNDIGGLGTVKAMLVDMFQPPLSQQNVSGPQQKLISPVQSLLLYGPPGCGKSMLARALCKQLNVPMLTIMPSLLLRMYVGETSRLTKALFTLARQIQPCLVFIDEADALFSARNTQGGHQVDRQLLTEFMQLWDDLLRENAEVYIIAATNRPQDLDPAVQRRFERSFLIGPPDLAARKEVLQTLLREATLDASFDFEMCARRMEGYTPSDMTAVCRAAMLLPVQEARRTQAASSGAWMPIPRPLKTEDIMASLQSVLPTTWASSTYGQQSAQQAPGVQQAGMQLPYDPSVQAHAPYGAQHMFPAPNNGYYYGPPGTNIGGAGGAGGAYYYSEVPGANGGYTYGAQGNAHNMHMQEEPEDIDDMYGDDEDE